eukprot:gene3521-21853_t
MTVRFGVRPTSFHQLSAIQQWRIDTLERKLAANEQR